MPTLASKLYTLLKTTLVSIQTFLLWLFVRTPAAALHAITPYPLRPDLEGRVLDISLSSIEAQDLDDSRVVPRMVMTSSAVGAAPVVDIMPEPTRRRAFSAPVVREAEIISLPSEDVAQTPPAQQNRNSLLPLYHNHRDIIGVSLKPAPLSLVTNVVAASCSGPPTATSMRTLVHTQSSSKSPPPKRKTHASSKSNEENISTKAIAPQSPARSVRRKPLPFKAASRYMDHISNNASTAIDASGPSLGLGKYSFPRRRSIVGRSGADKQAKPKEPAFDFAARVRSAFYGCRAFDDDECDVRELFKRESVVGNGHVHREIDSDCSDNISFYTSSVADGSFAFSTASDSDSSSSVDSPDPDPAALALPIGTPSRLTANSMILHRLQTSESASCSELPYLASPADRHISSCSMACEVSMMSAADVTTITTSDVDASATLVFNDLLASLERKFPGTEWGDIVRFEDVVKRITIGAKRVTFASEARHHAREEREKEDEEREREQEWSDVLSLADYVV
ncbi:hypothetical protein HMN09_01114500 [Mycena chlorophos]|uniref:Uncharacterized protein n=1 Tax=Mycena chlorophos TaxID=658473 RepID=A0A8H6SCZ0_MYCCL|nr:hypothetical protein HMN09_01114500 [Mycena chlorophos]